MSSIKTKLVEASVAVLGSLPLAAARCLGTGFAKLCLLLNDRNSKVTARNIALCFPQLDAQQQRDLTRASMLQTGRLAFEIFSVWRSNVAWRKKHTQATFGLEIMQGALAQGKGVIVLAPHIGNWEVLGASLPTLGSTTCMYQPPKQPYLNSVIVQSRENTGMTLVPTNVKGVAKLLKALKSGEIVGILPDQCPDMGGEFADFFGHPAYTMTLLQGLIQRTQCKVVAGVAKRVKGGFEFHYLNPDPAIYHPDLATSLAGLNRSVEACVALCPDQYQWEYKRFRKTPPTGEKFYQNL